MLKSEGLKSIISMSVGNISATVISAVAMIIFSRSLGPSQFGVFSVLFSLLLILSRVGDLGLNISVQRYIAQNAGNKALISRTTRVGWTLKLWIILTLFLVGIFGSNYITTQLLNLNESSTIYVALVFCLSIGVVFYEYVITILQGIRSFGFSILCNLVQSSTKLALALFSLLSHNLSLLAITFLYLLSPILGGFIGFAKIPLSSLFPLWDQKIIRQLLSVSRWTGIAIIAATIADNVDILIVQNLMSSYDTGLYSAAVRIASVASLLSYSLGTVLNVRVAAYKDKSHLLAYLKKAISLSVLSFVGIALLSFLSKSAIYITVGHEFLSAEKTLQLLFIATAVMTATSPFIALFYQFDRPEYFAISGILGSILLLGGDYFLIPMYGLNGAAYSRIIMRVLVLLFTLWYAKKSFQKHYAR